jgi:hypothetical protein
VIITNQIGEQITFHSFQTDLLGAFSLLHPQMTFSMDNQSINIQASRLRLSNYLFDCPSVDIDDLQMSMQHKTILSASYGAVIFPQGWKEPIIKIDSDRLSLDLDPLPSIPASNTRENASATSFPDVEEIRIHNARVRFPAGFGEFHWQGSLHSLPAKNEKRCSLLFTSPHDRSQQISLSAHFQPFPYQADIVQATIDRYFLSLMEPIPFSAILDGNLMLENDQNGMYDIRFDSKLLQFNAAMPNATTLSIPQTDVAFAGQWQDAIIPFAATAEIRHTSFVYRQSENWNLPSGISLFHMNFDDLSEPQFAGWWKSDALGEFHFASTGIPFSASTPLTVEFQIQETPLQAFFSHFPASYSNRITNAKGIVAGSGALDCLGSNVAKYNAQIQLSDGNWKSNHVSIAKSMVSSRIEGNSNSLSADLRLQGVVSVPFNDISALQFENVDIKAKLSYNINQDSYKIQFTNADSSLLRSVSGQYGSDGQWKFLGTLPLDEKLPAILADLIPGMAREVEGSGTLALSCQTTRDGIRATAACPEIVVYSFDQDPAWGIQAQNLHLEMQTKSTDNSSTRLAATIRADSPFLSFNGQSCEWPGSSLFFESTWETSPNAKKSLRGIPPGGGSIAIEQTENQIYQIHLHDLDLRTFCQPLIEHFLFEKEESNEEQSWNAEGKLDAWIHLDQTEELMQVKGIVTIHDADFTYSDSPHCLIRGATLTIPIAYPLTFASLPEHKIEFNAKSITLDGVAYPPIALSLPIDATSIRFPDRIVHTLFGGELEWNHMRILHWQTAKPEAHGNLVIHNMDISQDQLHFSALPKRGALSGTIEQIIASQDLVSVSGALNLFVFGGRIGIYSFFIKYPFTDFTIAGMDGFCENIDLEPLTEYFNFGQMSGVISGKMANMEVIVPPPGSTDLPQPIRFDIDLKSVKKGNGGISQETLAKIVDLGQTPGLARDMIQRKRYEYSQLGLRAILHGDDLQLYGTLKDNYFLAPSSNWFANKIAITLSAPGDVIPFRDFWNRLLSQMEE